MSEESTILTGLLGKLYFLTKDNEHWKEQLPVSFSDEFNHPRHGLVKFTFTIFKKNGLDPQPDQYVLSFRVTIHRSYVDRWISAGDLTKVIDDVLHCYVDPSRIEEALPDMYMGLLDYP